MQVVSVNTSPVEHFVATSGQSLESAIRKRPRTGHVTVGPLGLEGDEQADHTVHGGPAKAVYAYPSEHYDFWTTVRGQAQVAGALQPGDMGENLTLAGLLETKVWLGDVLRFADCEFIVSEPRYPCFKFTAHMGFGQAAKMMVQSGYCGFYLAVKREGRIAAGESFELVAGPREIGVVELFKARMKKR